MAKKWVGRKFTGKRLVAKEVIENTVSGAPDRGRKRSLKALEEEAARVKTLVAGMRAR